jgi:hypothetical protein
LIALIAWEFWPGRSSEQHDVAVIVPEPSSSSTNPPPQSTAPTNEPPANTEDAVAPVVRIVDGTSTIDLLPDGRVTGIEPEYETKVAGILKGGDLPIGDSGKDLRSGRGVLMGQNPPGKRFALIAPVGKVLLEDRPEFRWSSVKDADSYEVKIFDSNFNPVTLSGPLKTTRWTITKSLRRGGVYQWQVTATVGTEEIKSPVQPDSPARFKVVDVGKAAEIARARQLYPNRHLVLGILFAESGLLEAARREFELLSRSNPNSELPKRLLKEVRSHR